MSKYKPHVYSIRTLTNLHVGGTGDSFSIVDKQVQRDVTTRHPTIFSSGLKGALRDHFDDVLTNNKDAVIQHIFGSEPNNSGQPRQGKYRFLNADILVLPEPGGDSLYRPITSSCSLKNFRDKIALLGGTLANDFFNGWKPDDQIFAELATELPVIARNHLDDGGISQNLWYEEVVPREAVFGFAVLVPDGDNYFDIFNQNIDGKVIQIGANATVGYGLCLFTKISQP